MITLLVVLAILSLLFIWSSLTTCSLATFDAMAIVPSQLRGPEVHRRFVEALLTLPGVHLIDRDEQDALVSVMPVPSSMERGFGLFVVARSHNNEVLLLGRNRLPLPRANVAAALRQLEREARIRCTP